MSLSLHLSEIPSKYQSVFHPIKEFNQVQTDVFNDVFKTEKHIVVSAPAGSGKTVIFELAIVKLLMSLEQAKINLQSVKIVYVAPMKSLCNEIHQKWSKKFEPFGMNVALATDDCDPMEMIDLNGLSSFQIIITTPEKFDSMTRQWREQSEIAYAIRLVLIDEVHFVGEEFRGPTLEAIVSRIKTFYQSDKNNEIRFIAVSLSLPNIQDVAKWIGSGQSINSVETFKFVDNEQAVKIHRYVRGYNGTYGNYYQMEKMITSMLIDILYELLEEKLSNQQKILIFCPTRANAESTLEQIENNFSLTLSASESEHLQRISKSIQDKKLRRLIENGFAYHHAGITFQDRECIENAYRSTCSIKILVCTNTLAMGVNLPAHTVIIKGTEIYSNGINREMSESVILQMIGRAGRQEYNSTGRVYIITRSDNVNYYKNLSVGSVEMESHLKPKLAKILNAEIALNTITDAEASLMKWLRTTFLYARIVDSTAKNRSEAKLKELCETATKELQFSNLIRKQLDGSFVTLPVGTIMAKYFLSFETIKLFQTHFCGTETIPEVLEKIILFNEFSEMFIRKNEKSELNALNKKIRYTIKQKFDSPPQKVSCLLQALLGHLPIQSSPLIVESQKIQQIAERILNSIVEFLQSDQFPYSCYKAMLSTTILIKSVRKHTWNDCNVFEGLNISESDANKLIQAGIRSIDDLLRTNSRKIENLIRMHAPYGNDLIEEAKEKFPRYKIDVNAFADETLSIRITQVNLGYTYNPDVDTGLILLIGDSDNNFICYEDIQDTLDEAGFYGQICEIDFETAFVFIHLIHNNLAGVDKMVQYDCKAKKIISNGYDEDTTSETKCGVMTSSKNKTLKMVTKISNKISKDDLKNQSTLTQCFVKKEQNSKTMTTSITVEPNDDNKNVHRSKRLTQSYVCQSDDLTSKIKVEPKDDSHNAIGSFFPDTNSCSKMFLTPKHEPHISNLLNDKSNGMMPFSQTQGFAQIPDDLLTNIKVKAKDVNENGSHFPEAKFSPEICEKPKQESQMPNLLYDFSHGAALCSQAQNDAQILNDSPNYLTKVELNDENQNINAYDFMDQTQIEWKLRKHRNTEDDLTIGFVRANTIFNTELVDKRSTQKQNDETIEIVPDLTDIETHPATGQFDEEENNVLDGWKTRDGSQSDNNRLHGLANSSLHLQTNSKTYEDVQKIVNCNINHFKMVPIEMEYEDDENELDCSNQATNIHLDIEFLKEDDDIEITNYPFEQTHDIRQTGITPKSLPTSELSSSMYDMATNNNHAFHTFKSTHQQAVAIGGPRKKVPKSNEQKLKISKETMSCFTFKSPQKMQLNEPVLKKPKVDLEVLQKNALVGAKLVENKQQPVKTSLKKTFARITRSDIKPDVNIGNVIEQYQQRMKKK